MKFGLIVLGIFVLSLFSVSAADLTATVCCEKTVQGAFCQDAPASQCDANFRSVPTSCQSTSYCKLGTCYDSNEGMCLDNTPQLVCNQKGGIWSEEAPAQCNLGCCMLGDQAAFVSLVRCKKLSAALGVEANYDTSIGSEIACVASVQEQDRGACVYDFEFQRTCKFTTRAECSSKTQTVNGTTLKGGFFKDKLCTAEELATNCGPTTRTTCLPGKDEVYFVDTCGNPANIYDSSKIKDDAYWTNAMTKEESCNPLTGNIKSASCGNCNYLLGSYCRTTDVSDGRVSYGSSICADLNCVDEDGNKRRHGESWCIGDDAKSKLGVGENSIGSRFYRRICQNGVVVTEPCADFRNEECVEDSIETSVGSFAQSACRVNRWQDCLAQTTERDCENSDRRDCFWKPGVILTNATGGLCLPATSPGLNFWSSEESRVICGQANKACIVKFEKGLFGGEKCTDNCECLEQGWEQQYGSVCSAIADCGVKLNWQDKPGFNEGVNKTIRKS